VPSGALQRGQQGASGADSGLPASMSTPLPRTAHDDYAAETARRGNQQ
jgi:hypothetical protein